MEQNPQHASQNFWTLLEKYKTQAAVFLGLVVIASSLFYGWDFFRTKKENQALDSYSEGEKLYLATLGAEEFTASKNTSAEKTQVDASPAINKFENVIQNFPGTRAHFLSAFRLSEIYLKQNNLEKSETILEPVYSQGSLKDMMVTMLALRLTGVYERNKKCDKAVPVLEKIAAETPFSSFKPESLMRLALCQEQLGQSEKAVETYKRLSKEHPESGQGKQAQKFLKILGS